MGQGTMAPEMPPYQTTMDNNNRLLTSESDPKSDHRPGPDLTSDPMMTDHTSHCEVQPRKCKCVLLGDGAVGKTSLTVSYTTNGYPTEYIPTAFDNYSVVVTVDNRPVQVQLCDTAGQEDFDTLRTLCYPDTHVFLVCFSVVSPTSFHNVVEKWIPEIKRTSPKIPIILIGTQSDLRNDVKVLIDLASRKERPISEATAAHTAVHLAAGQYIECSALTQHNLKEVFDSAIFTGLKYAETQSVGNTSEAKTRKSSRKAKTKASNTGTPQNVNNDSLKNSKPGWKKLCCFIT